MAHNLPGPWVCAPAPTFTLVMWAVRETYTVAMNTRRPITQVWRIRTHKPLASSTLDHNIRVGPAWPINSDVIHATCTMTLIPALETAT